MRADWPNGLFICATLNRTTKAFLLAIVGAEYVMVWSPRRHTRLAQIHPPFGTDCKPSTQWAMRVEALTGVSLDPIGGNWRLSRDPDVNYMLAATKPA